MRLTLTQLLYLGNHDIVGPHLRTTVGPMIFMFMLIHVNMQLLLLCANDRIIVIQNMMLYELPIVM